MIGNTPVPIVQLPTTLSIPLDGYCASVELSPAVGAGPDAQAQLSVAHALMASLASPAGTSQLQAQIAQQMLAFATQQATLLQQVRVVGMRARTAQGHARMHACVVAPLAAAR